MCVYAFKLNSRVLKRYIVRRFVEELLQLFRSETLINVTVLGLNCSIKAI